MKHLLRVLGFAIVLAHAPHLAYADWMVDGNAVSTDADLQMNPAIASDGGTGAIMTWQDRRDGTSFNIYVQKFDASGNALWTPNGVAVCLEANDQADPRLVPDGAGGAIVVWEDARTSTNFDIFAQRVDADGVPQWATDGVPLCELDFNQHNPAIVSDDQGGAIIVWQDHRGGSTPDVYAQRVDADGNPLWDADGVAVCTATRAQANPIAVADGAEGIIACWVDRRAGLGDIYVQHVDADGNATWTANGVGVCTEQDDQSAPALVSDQLGGAYVAWADNRIGDLDIYAQYVDFAGVAQWTSDGIAVCAQPLDQNRPVMVGDGLATLARAAVPGGAIVAWEDFRNGLGSDIYAGHIDGAGNLAWIPNGVPLCTAPLDQIKPAITTDASHGAIVAWQDHRPNYDTDIYARRIDENGSPQWEINGVRVCGASGSQYDPVAVFGDAGAAIVVWEDLRSGTYDAYANNALGAPTTVAIISFDATWEGDGVALRAAFRSNSMVEGVNVYRGGPHGVLKKIDGVAGVSAENFEYLDRDVVHGETYRYQIGVVDADGEFFSAITTVTVAKVALSLDQNHPNPFNPATTIRFVVPERGQVSLVVYDASGHAIRTLVNDVIDAGAREAIWDGRDDRGVAQSSGVYFYRLQAGKRIESRKMVLVK